MVNLDIREDKVFIIEMIEKSDEGNTYKAFSNAYWIDARDKFANRYYFSSFDIRGFETYKSFYSYDDSSNDVKHRLNSFHQADIRYMSEHKNIVVFCETVSRAKFDRLTKTV
jgi:hypothetical protein